MIHFDFRTIVMTFYKFMCLRICKIQTVFCLSRAENKFVGKFVYELNGVDRQRWKDSLVRLFVGKYIETRRSGRYAPIILAPAEGWGPFGRHLQIISSCRELRYSHLDPLNIKILPLFLIF